MYFYRISQMKDAHDSIVDFREKLETLPHLDDLDLPGFIYDVCESLEKFEETRDIAYRLKKLEDGIEHRSVENICEVLSTAADDITTEILSLTGR